MGLSALTSGASFTTPSSGAGSPWMIAGQYPAGPADWFSTGRNDQFTHGRRDIFWLRRCGGGEG